MDHLVFAAPDLEEGVRHVERLLGVETQPGGQHLGLGTRNRLVALGPDVYLEVVGVDPEQPEPAKARWFGLDDLSEPRLVTWCAKADDLERVAARGRAAGLELGAPISGGRRRSDGRQLRWTFTDPWTDRAAGVVPFFIDWGGTEHPARGLPVECRLLDLRVEHPEAERVRGWLAALGLDTAAGYGHAPRVIATIESPNGIVELS